MKHDSGKILLIFLLRFRRNVRAVTLSGIFEIPESTVQSYFHKVLGILDDHFTPEFLGFSLLSQKELLEHHTPHAAKDVLKGVTASADGTYFRIQKSQDHELQYASYSYKGYNLVKTMDFTALDGYVIEIFGPFKSDGSNDDGSMMNAVVVRAKQFVTWMQGFKTIVDRGFKKYIYNDIMELIAPGGIDPKKEKQLPTKVANEARNVTKFRNTHECHNGR